MFVAVKWESIVLYSSPLTKRTPWSSVLLEKLIVAHWSRNSPPDKEPRHSLLRLQEPTTGLHPEPGESSSQPHIIFFGSSLVLFIWV